MTSFAFWRLVFSLSIKRAEMEKKLYSILSTEEVLHPTEEVLLEYLVTPYGLYSCPASTVFTPL